MIKSSNDGIQISLINFKTLCMHKPFNTLSGDIRRSIYVDNPKSLAGTKIMSL